MSVQQITNREIKAEADAEALRRLQSQQEKDRLAVRTFVSPFDPVTVREALLRMESGSHFGKIVIRVAEA